tara:strand:- start:413 stop:550 length:138 start_codon:yes stop_codon:yes gene_type:complete
MIYKGKIKNGNILKDEEKGGGRDDEENAAKGEKDFYKIFSILYNE